MNTSSILKLSSAALLSASALFASAATEPIAAQSATKPAPTAAAVTATKKIGVSIPAADHGWTAGVVWWAKECAKLHPEIEWTIATAETPEKQVSDIETLMAKKVDALVILATESAPITPVAEEAHNRGILVVNVDRGFLKPVADIFIEGDNKAFGRKSAEFMVSKLGGKGKATGNREFEVLFDESRGSSGATMFVGFIPTSGAPAHYHLYDEICHIVRGGGTFVVGDTKVPIGPGSTFMVVPRMLHSIVNEREEDLWILGTFRPAGSPAAAYYPDGRPAPGYDEA